MWRLDAGLGIKILGSQIFQWLEAWCCTNHFTPSGPQFPHSQNGEARGSKILTRDKRKLPKNRHKLVKMQRINGMHVVECCVPEGSSAEASSQVQKSNMDVCVSAGVGGLRGQRQEAILIKGKMATNYSPLASCAIVELRSLFLYS